MRKLKLFLTFALALLIINTVATAQASKQIYESPNLPALLGRAKKVAILPFTVNISYKKMPKGANPELIKEDEKKESIQMQQGMYTFLLRKAEKYSVSFQDVDKTVALLKQAGAFDKCNDMLADSLCKILGVDAIIKSSWSYQKTGSEAGAIASAVILGISKPTGSGQLVMQIYDAKDGELAWRMAKEMNEGAFSSANELMERMMRKVGRNFPFEK
jgi:hypothetical protein